MLKNFMIIKTKLSRLLIVHFFKNIKDFCSLALSKLAIWKKECFTYLYQLHENLSLIKHNSYDIFQGPYLKKVIQSWEKY